MTWVAEVTGVLVLIAAALGQRLDVIDDGCDPHQPLVEAVLTEAIGALESAFSLGYRSSSAETRCRLGAFVEIGDVSNPGTQDAQE